MSLFAAAVTHLAAQAIDELDAERLQVQNYRTVCVYFDEIIQKDNRTPLSTASMRNRVEVRLRAAGLRPLDLVRDVDACQPAKAFLNVGVHFSGNAFIVKVEFIRQVAWWVRPERADDIKSGPAPVRQDESLGVHGGQAGVIMDALDEMLDRFLNAYLKANQP